MNASSPCLQSPLCLVIYMRRNSMSIEEMQFCEKENHKAGLLRNPRLKGCLGQTACGILGVDPVLVILL